MKGNFCGVRRRLKTCASSMALAAITAWYLTSATQTHAQTSVSLYSKPFVVKNDRGGLLRDRLSQLQQLRQSGTPVEIRGGVCFSTCTMFLGLPNTCVSSNTTFGFHGPSSYGRALDPVTFNRASEVIASYYPAVLRNWYMEEGRYRIRSFYRIKGSDIIRMGVREC